SIICGSIASKITQMDKKIDYKNAEVLDVKDRYCPNPGSKAMLFPLHANEGRAEIAIFWE
ncbi:MAG TPA: hypothetical protein VIX18_03930, partial [Nitrospirota bacterium]